MFSRDQLSVTQYWPNVYGVAPNMWRSPLPMLDQIYRAPSVLKLSALIFREFLLIFMTRYQTKISNDINFAYLLIFKLSVGQLGNRIFIAPMHFLLPRSIETMKLLSPEFCFVCYSARWRSFDSGYTGRWNAEYTCTFMHVADIQQRHLHCSYKWTIISRCVNNRFLWQWIWRRLGPKKIPSLIYQHPGVISPREFVEPIDWLMNDSVQGWPKLKKHRHVSCKYPAGRQRSFIWDIWY